jgi:hypothetical protein
MYSAYISHVESENGNFLLVLQPCALFDSTPATTTETSPSLKHAVTQFLLGDCLVWRGITRGSSLPEI